MKDNQNYGTTRGSASARRVKEEAERIYLADLAYDTVRTNHVVPLNVGYMAAALDARFGKAVDITLFKYPTELEEAIRDQPPDMLGLSHYSWNTRLNEVFLEMARRLNPNTITVMGGPNIRNDAPSIDMFPAPPRQHRLLHPVRGRGPRSSTWSRPCLGASVGRRRTAAPPWSTVNWRMCPRISPSSPRIW